MEIEMSNARPGRISKRAGVSFVLAASAFAVSALVASLLVAASDPVTGGAAPGYVDDQVCARCHVKIAESYREVGMARSFYRPLGADRIEDFSAPPFVHEASERAYRIAWEGEELIFRRWVPGPDGEKNDLFEVAVDWILGSGSHSRTYLFRTANGELYQLPLAWYSQPGAIGWGMAPGFDRADHLGVNRQVRSECMVCHNAFPEVPVGSDLRWEPEFFPADLPEGIGCQRCHGPGGEHVRLAKADRVDFHRLAAAIVNPADLSPERRDDICFGCHLQPSVAIPGLRRFERGEYAFRPGQRLSDHAVPVDVVIEGEDRSERFEINHHPYRLRQSRCYLEGGEMSCLTCHDPHRKVPVAERAAHYRAACQSCHAVDACALEAMGAAARTALPDALRSVDAGDCVACHMQERRTQDVVQVTMTDHRIRRRPAPPEELLAPRGERESVALLDVEIPSVSGAPTGNLAEIYRAAAVLRAGSRGEVVDHLRAMLDKEPQPSAVPYLDLASALLSQRRLEETEKALDEALQRAPGHYLALDWGGLIRVMAGDLEGAVELLEQAVEASPLRAESHFNLGRVLYGMERPGEALPSLRRAVELRRNLTRGWLFLGQAEEDLGHPEAAREAYRQALSVDPADARARRRLADLDAAPARRDAAEETP